MNEHDEVAEEVQAVLDRKVREGTLEVIMEDGVEKYRRKRKGK